jgi:hypothetical protein
VRLKGLICATSVVFSESRLQDRQIVSTDELRFTPRVSRFHVKMVTIFDRAWKDQTMLVDTALFITAASIAFLLGIGTALAARSGAEYRGYIRWIAANCLTAVCFLLHAIERGRPSYISAADAAGILAAVTYLEGVREYCGLLPRHWVLSRTGLLALAVVCWLEYSPDKASTRVFVGSIYIGGVFLASTSTLIARRSCAAGPSFYLTMTAFASYGVLSFIHSVSSLRQWNLPMINVLAVIAWTVGLLLMMYDRLVGDLRKAHARMTKLNEQLQDSLAQVKLLSGLLPICASCKKIRDETGVGCK